MPGPVSKMNKGAHGRTPVVPTWINDQPHTRATCTFWDRKVEPKHLGKTYRDGRMADTFEAPPMVWQCPICGSKPPA